MRVPITAHAVSVSDMVERALALLKDRKDPATKPSTDLQSRSTTHSPLHVIGDHRAARNSPWLSTRFGLVHRWG
jgi:hypothetical protein